MTDSECPPLRVVARFPNAAPACAAALAAVQILLERGDLGALAGRLGVGARDAEAVVAVFDIDDTLIMDFYPRFVPNKALLGLYNDLRALGVQVHLVTARPDNADTRAWTEEQLAAAGVVGYASLHLAPERVRTSMHSTSAWKQRARKGISEASGRLVALTVGDQWGDMVVLSDDGDIESMDAYFRVEKEPYLLVRPEDGVSAWGLKLRALP